MVFDYYQSSIFIQCKGKYQKSTNSRTTNKYSENSYFIKNCNGQMILMSICSKVIER